MFFNSCRFHSAVTWTFLVFYLCGVVQVDAAKYGGIVNGFRVSIREGGLMELTKGWAPTLIGYSMQGLCKFGFYEVFKNVYGNLMGEVCSHFRQLYPG